MRRVNTLHTLAMSKARPINGDAVRAVTPMAKKPKKPGKAAAAEKKAGKPERFPRQQPTISAPRKRVVKRDGTVIE